MRKRKASLYPASERPALAVLPAHSRFLVRTKLLRCSQPSTASRASRNSVQGRGGPLSAL
jgi:hypothetical protein